MFDIELTTIPASCENDELTVYYNYLTATQGQTIIVVAFHAEHASSETSVEAVKAAIEQAHPGKTVLITDTANDN